MRKNPGRKDRRRTHRINRTQYSEKKSAINERYMLWKRNWLKRRKKCAHFDKIFPEYAKEERA